MARRVSGFGLSSRLSPLTYHRLGRARSPDRADEHDFHDAERGRSYRLSEEDARLIDRAISLPTISSVQRAALLSALVALSRSVGLDLEKRDTLDEFVRLSREEDGERRDCARGVGALLAVLDARDRVGPLAGKICDQKRALDRVVDDARDDLLCQLDVLSEWSRELWDAARPGMPVSDDVLHGMRRLAGALDDLIRVRSGVEGATLRDGQCRLLEGRLSASSPVFGERSSRVDALRSALADQVHCARCGEVFIASSGDVELASVQHQSVCASNLAELERLRSMRSLMGAQVRFVARLGGAAATAYRLALSRQISSGGPDVDVAREMLSIFDSHAREAPSHGSGDSPAFALVPICGQCGERPAACIGSYEGGGDGGGESPACDVCCGHGNEDGRCRPLGRGDWAVLS
jgi:hypothetical protein